MVSKICNFVTWFFGFKQVKFLTTGGFLYLLSVYLMYAFEETLHFGNTRAYIYQTLITYALQFLINALWTWRDRKGELGIKIGKYLLLKAILWTSSQFVFASWVSLGLHYQIGNALTVITIMGINYFVFDKWIFSGNSEKETTKRTTYPIRSQKTQREMLEEEALGRELLKRADIFIARYKDTFLSTFGVNLNVVFDYSMGIWDLLMGEALFDKEIVEKLLFREIKKCFGRSALIYYIWIKTQASRIPHIKSYLKEQWGTIDWITEIIQYQRELWETQLENLYMLREGIQVLLERD